MSDSLISILLPVKNAEPYLADCLNSIINQSEKHWELLAVEDHSTDQSFAILKAFGQKDPRINVFRNDGQGIIPALRKAYSESRGQLITRMDADDLMEINKLAALKTLLLQNGPGYIGTALVSYFSEYQLGKGYLNYQNWLNDLSRQENNFIDIYKECVIPSPCWMVFRKDLDNSAAFHPDTYPEDYDLCFRFYKNGLTIKTAQQVLHQWRDYPERTSRNDPNYADVHFFELKIQYFLDLDYNSERPLLLWGAGRKGKELAQLLIKKNIPFQWITDNSKKIDKDIYGVKLLSTSYLQQTRNPQIIIAVAAPDALVTIHQQLEKHHLKKAKDFFLFC